MSEIFSLENDDRPMRSRRATMGELDRPHPAPVNLKNDDDGDDSSLSSCHSSPGQQRNQFSIPRSLHNLFVSRSYDAMDATEIDNIDDYGFRSGNFASGAADEEQLDGIKQTSTDRLSLSSGDGTELILPAPESSEDEDEDSFGDEEDDVLGPLESGTFSSGFRSARFNHDHGLNSSNSDNQVDNIRRAISDRELKQYDNSDSHSNKRPSMSRESSVAKMSRQLSQIMQLPPSENARNASLTAQKYYRKSQHILSTDVMQLAEEELTEHDKNKLKDVACCITFALCTCTLLFFLLKQ